MAVLHAVAVFAEDILGLFGDEFVEGAPRTHRAGGRHGIEEHDGRAADGAPHDRAEHVAAGEQDRSARDTDAVSLLLVPVLGILGAALAYALGVLVDTTLATFQVSTRLGFRGDARSMLSAAAIPVFGVLVTGLILAWLLSGAPVSVRLTAIGVVLAAYVAGLGVLLRKKAAFFERAALI